jgi:hypothetical protein
VWALFIHAAVKTPHPSQLFFKDQQGSKTIGGLAVVWRSWSLNLPISCKPSVLYRVFPKYNWTLVSYCEIKILRPPPLPPPHRLENEWETHIHTVCMNVPKRSVLPEMNRLMNGTWVAWRKVLQEHVYWARYSHTWQHFGYRTISCGDLSGWMDGYRRHQSWRI